jgi:exodeoxyribonuclease V gamma subunit
VIHICTSHRTEILLGIFVQNLSAERQRKGALAPVHVVVPNRNVETYLRLKVAERCGIAANIETTFLRKLLVGITEQALPDVRVADVANIEGHLLALLHDDAVLADPVLEAVRTYLAAAQGDRDALDRRRCQLAGKLAQLFDEYAGSRPGMLTAWAEGKADPSDTSEAAAWQRALWLAIFGPEGRLALEAKQTKLRTLPLEWLFQEAMQVKPVPFAGQTVHVFGLSYIATAYHRMLATLARDADVREANIDVRIYTLSPCREDRDALVAKAQTRMPSNAADPFGLLDDGNQALALWARPGRENLRLLAALPGATVQVGFREDDDEPLTLLRRLQNDIVHGRAADRAAKPSQLDKFPPADDSLRIFPCPSLRRELEVVAAEIWQLARKDPTLRLCDVAVVVPETSKELYLAQLSAVFGESCGLPHSVTDLPGGSGSRVTEAIQLLLDLPFSSFTRRDLLPLLTHPCLMARFPKATPEHWRALAQTLGIVRGADRDEFAGSYITRDLFSWDQGLRRLALGALVDAAENEAAAPILLGGEPYLSGPPLGDDDDASLGFGLLARSLIADARFASGHGSPMERPLREWLGFVRDMVQAYLVLDDDDGAGKAVVTGFFAQLEELWDNGLGDRPISYRVASELAKHALAALPSSRGHYLASGVTVASFVPMRAIPFRAVFVLGLGQEAFPRPVGQRELDLRCVQRHPGDVDRREQDLYMFLETLLSARGHVRLSYVARDEITGDELPSSSVLIELRTILAQGYLDPTALARLFCDDVADRPALRRYDDTVERRQVLPVAEGEYRSKELGRSLMPPHPGRVSWGERVNSLPATLGKGLARLLSLSPAATAAAREQPQSVLVIPLSALRRFLEDPLQGSARFRLHLREEDDRAFVDTEEESFDAERQVLAGVLRASMTGALMAAQALPSWENVLAAYSEKALNAELVGRSPTGLFRTACARVEESILRAWHRDLPSVLGPTVAQATAQPRISCRTVRLSPADMLTDVDDHGVDVEYRKAPQLSVLVPGLAGEPQRSVQISIEGQTGVCAFPESSRSTSLTFSCRRKIEEEQRSREELHAFLDYVVLSASGASAQASTRGHCSALFFTRGDTGAVRPLCFRPLERERALAYLARLCTDLLTGVRDTKGTATGVHAYLLPHEAVFASRRRGSSIRDEIVDLCGMHEARAASFSSLQGPVPRVLDRYAPPTEKDAQRMALERFGLFFELADEDNS